MGTHHNRIICSLLSTSSIYIFRIPNPNLTPTAPHEERSNFLLRLLEPTGIYRVRLSFVPLTSAAGRKPTSRVEQMLLHP